MIFEVGDIVKDNTGKPGIIVGHCYSGTSDPKYKSFLVLLNGTVKRLAQEHLFKIKEIEKN